MSQQSEWDSLVRMAQDYCATKKPDTVEIAGFISWAHARFFVKCMDFSDALDLVEAKMKPEDR